MNKAAGYLYAKHLTSGCLRLPETALSSGIKNSGRPLDSGWVVQRFRWGRNAPQAMESHRIM